MIDYKHSSCQYCKKKFEPSDNIVVCPECGAPYHKECVEKSGKCVYADKHSDGFRFSDPEAEKAEQKAQTARCPICGFENPPEAIYCNRCGGSMNRAAGTGAEQNPGFGGFSGQAAGFGMNFQTVDPNEEIAGVKAGDIEKYVGTNGAYFIPRFQDIQNKTKRYPVFNLSALFFEYWYFLYRKMYGIAAISFVISLILNMPSTLYSLSTAGFVDLNIDTSVLLMLNSVTYVLSILFRAFLSYWANRLYLKKAVKDIKGVKSKGLPRQEYESALVKRGSTSRTSIIVCASVYLVLIFAATLIALSI